MRGVDSAKGVGSDKGGCGGSPLIMGAAQRKGQTDRQDRTLPSHKVIEFDKHRRQKKG